MSKKILMIEDDRIILKNTVAILNLEGYDAFGAENGQIGLDMARKHLPDLIISDVMMPVMNGLQVLAAVREDPHIANTPFIFLTAQSEKANIRQGMGAGADDYLTKPFTIPELMDAVRARLDRHAMFLREQQRRLDELRGNLIHMLPHELRTPLVSILGNADFVLEYGTEMSQRDIIEMMRSIKRGGQRLYRLIENYLLSAQIEIIKSEPERMVALRRSVVERPTEVIAERARAAAGNANRESDLHLHVEAAAPIHASEDSFAKIVDEIVDNAFKFSEANTAVEVATALEADHFAVQVTDQGRGMSAVEIARIGSYIQFQRKLYEQQGTGLGLSLVRDLMVVFGGTLNIESTPGKYTRVTVRFPLQSD